MWWGLTRGVVNRFQSIQSARSWVCCGTLCNSPRARLGVLTCLDTGELHGDTEIPALCSAHRMGLALPCWRFPLQTQQKTWHLHYISWICLDLWSTARSLARFVSWLMAARIAQCHSSEDPPQPWLPRVGGPREKSVSWAVPCVAYERRSNSEVESRVLRSAMAHAGHTATRITDLFFSWIWRCHLHHLHPPGKFGESVQDAEPGDSIFLYFSGATPREQGLTGTDRDWQGLTGTDRD